MIKTVKVKKKLNLSELIAYISVSGIKDANFVSNYEKIVSVDHSGQITTVGKFYNDTFIVEVDKEITKNTPFGRLVAVNSYGSLARYEATTIADVLSDDGADCFATKIYALIENELEIIWEAE